MVGCVDDKMFCEMIFKKSTNVIFGQKTGDPEKMESLEVNSEYLRT